MAGLAAVALLQTYWYLQPIPIAAKALTAGLLAGALVRPTFGMLAFAGLAPVSTAIANLCGGAPGLGAHLLEQMALAAAAGVLSRGGPTDGRTRIGAPAMLMAVVAMASAVAMIPAAAAADLRGIWDSGLLHQLANRRTAESSLVWAPVLAALAIALCGLLGWAVERTVRQSPGLGTRLVALGLIGHAAAGLLALRTVMGVALRTGEALASLPRLLMTLRISEQTDVHAAASALLLAGVAGLGLFSPPWWRRLGVSVALFLIAAGMWITGSRVAMALAVVGAGATVIWSGAFRGWRRVLVISVAIVAITAGSFATFYPNNRYRPATTSASSRLVLMRVGLELFKRAPVFGIGIARFYPESAAVGGPDMKAQVGYTHQNAHNNFVQVLAEQGLVGLAVMLWWLGGILIAGFRDEIAHYDVGRRPLLLGILACIGTWMAGHPLLVPEFAFVFWLYFGILAAMTRAPAAGPLGWIVWALVAALLISVPLRARALANNIDREHQGIGVSALWGHEDEQRYREAGASFALYLPATGRPVEVPVRRSPGVTEVLLIEVRIGGRLMDTVPVADDAWQRLLIPVPAGPRRFELVDFSVRVEKPGAALPDVLLRVGRDTVR